MEPKWDKGLGVVFVLLQVGLDISFLFCVFFLLVSCISYFHLFFLLLFCVGVFFFFFSSRRSGGKRDFSLIVIVCDNLVYLMAWTVIHGHSLHVIITQCHGDRAVRPDQMRPNVFLKVFTSQALAKTTTWAQTASLLETAVKPEDRVFCLFVCLPSRLTLISLTGKNFAVKKFTH